MPRESQKRRIIDSLISNGITKVRRLEEHDDEDTPGIAKVFDELYEDLTFVLLCRRGVESDVPRPLVERDKILTSMTDATFKELLRVDRHQFDLLHMMIREDKEFIKSHSCMQFSTEIQLAAALCRLGAVGETASIRVIASHFGLSDGGSLYKITERVVAAFLRILPKYLKWPNQKERADIVRETYDELPHCIGYVETMEVLLTDPPSKMPETFYSSTHNYSIKAQLVCDYKYRIRDVVVGNPGGRADAAIFRNCSLVRRCKVLFSPQQWLAGEITLPLMAPVITPYTMDTVGIEERHVRFNRQFRKFHARSGVCIELLKRRWRSLQTLRVRILNEKSQKLCCHWVLVCCMLHNILLRSGDVKEYLESVGGELKERQVAECLSSGKVSVEMQQKRDEILELMCP